jgi:hypothetical protein
VLTPAGTSGATNADVFNYYAVITGVSPKYGPIDGGMAITVNGSGFQRGGSEFSFSGTPARSFNCHGSDTVCQVVTPAHSAGTADITLGPGSPTPSDRYTYQFPTVSNISPLIGPTTGGTRVTLYGSGLSPNMTVKFGGTVADQKTISCSSDDNSCTVTSPAYITSTVVGCSVCAANARPNGITGPLPPSGVASVLISVVINNVTSRPLVNDEFTYAIFPEVHGISPLSGPRAGNIKVTVTGANFSVPQGSTSFLFGSSAATNVQCGSSTQCMMTVPAWNSALDPYTQVVVTAAVDGNKSQITAIFYYDVTYIGASAVPTADGATPTATDYRP